MMQQRNVTKKAFPTRSVSVGDSIQLLGPTVEATTVGGSWPEKETTSLEQ